MMAGISRTSTKVSARPVSVQYEDSESSDSIDENARPFLSRSPTQNKLAASDNSSIDFKV